MKCVECKERMAVRGDKCFECADAAIRKQTFGPFKRGHHPQGSGTTCSTGYRMNQVGRGKTGGG